MKSENLVQGGKVAKNSFLIQLAMGFVEVLAGIFSLSIALIADGIQSFADAGVSLIVWIGLRISGRAPDGRFHFGYYRVETLSSVIAALLMASLGVVLLYVSYVEYLNPTVIGNAELAMAVALSAAIVAIALLIYKTRAARRYGSQALKTDASNSIRDVLTSATAFIGVAASKYFNVVQMDAIAGIIISLFVFTVVYPILKESSLVLLDACQNPEIQMDFENIARSIRRVEQVHSIRIRKLGSYLVGDMHVKVDGNMTVKEADEIANEIEERLKQEFDEVIEIKVRIEPNDPKTGQKSGTF